MLLEYPKYRDNETDKVLGGELGLDFLFGKVFAKVCTWPLDFNIFDLQISDPEALSFAVLIVV